MTVFVKNLTRPTLVSQKAVRSRVPARSCRRSSYGFTLIELLIVVVIVAIMAATVVISYSGGDRARRLQVDAQRVASLFELARTEALRRNQEWGAFVDESSLSFAHFDDVNREWVEYSERPLAKTTLENIKLELRVDNQLELPKRFEKGDVPDIVFFSSGEAMKFDLRLQPNWETAAWTISSDGLSRSEAVREEFRRR